MRVLVTGGAGRLGITVCNKLVEDGLQVRVFDLETARNRKSVKGLKGQAEVCWGDITQPDSVRRALQDVDAVVHMAGVLPPLADDRPDVAERVNVGGTGVLVDLIKELGGHIPLVFTSSVAVFGPTPHATEPLSPDKNEPHPEGGYAVSKHRAEELIKESGIDYTILRLTATMYLELSMSDIKRLFGIPLGSRVEFCHPEDTAVAILNAVRNFDLVKGSTLVISGGPDQRMTYRDMTRAMLGLMGLPLPPARKFTEKPYYLDWYDTSRTQEILRCQRTTFSDYLGDYSKTLSRRYSVLFLPFMCYFVGPVFGKLIVRFF